jgi:hypothetical protein
LSAACALLVYLPAHPEILSSALGLTWDWDISREAAMFPAALLLIAILFLQTA